MMHVVKLHASHLPLPPIKEGILLVDKPPDFTAFDLVTALRKLSSIRTIGHAGTLDPFATGLMVMLIGKEYTSQSQHYLLQEKEYECLVRLGETTDSHDCEGKIIATSSLIPTYEEVIQNLFHFQGNVEQIPPMFSAKKLKGKRLYELARLGLEVKRNPILVSLKTTLLSYEYPFIRLHIVCSKGTFIRVIGHDLGIRLGCGAHLTALRRIRSGSFQIKDSIDGRLLYPSNWTPRKRKYRNE